MGQAFSRSYGLAPRPPPPPPSPVSKLYRPHTGRLRKGNKLLTGVVKGVGKEPKSHYRKEVWSSINHLILSCIDVFLSAKKEFRSERRGLCG